MNDNVPQDLYAILKQISETLKDIAISLKRIADKK